MTVSEFLISFALAWLIIAMNVAVILGGVVVWCWVAEWRDRRDAEKNRKSRAAQGLNW